MGRHVAFSASVSLFILAMGFGPRLRLGTPFSNLHLCNQTGTPIRRDAIRTLRLLWSLGLIHLKLVLCSLHMLAFRTRLSQSELQQGNIGCLCGQKLTASPLCVDAEL